MKTFKQFFLMAAVAMMAAACGNIDNPLEEIAGSGAGGAGGEGGGGGSTPSQTAATIKYASTTLKRGTADPAFTYDLANSGDGAVVYESSDPTIAEVNATTGEVTPKAEGTCGVNHANESL